LMSAPNPEGLTDQREVTGNKPIAQGNALGKCDCIIVSDVK